MMNFSEIVSMNKNPRLHASLEQSAVKPVVKPMARRAERGIALLISMIMLFILATLALASMDMAMRDAQVVGAKKSSEAALQMAEAGVSEVLDYFYNTYDPVDYPGPGTTVDIAEANIAGTFAQQGAYESGTGSFDLTGEMSWVGLGEGCMMTDPPHHYGVWDVTVQGVAPGGQTSSIIHFSLLKCQCTSPTGCG